MKKILIILLLLVIQLPTFATEWVKIGNNLYLDKSSIRYSSKNRTYKAWVKEIKTKEIVLYFNEYNIKEKEWRALDIVTTDLKNNIKKRETPNSVGLTWINVVPDTNSAFEYQEIKKQITKSPDILEKELRID